jgi:AcrR family transcriptional regulator
MRRSPRERMVFSAAQLIRRHGVAGTGMREVVAHADAPRGSLQHYFPGGKDQLVAEAARWGGDYAAKRVDKFLAALPERTPGALLEAMAVQWREDFLSEGYQAGCPVAASVVDCSAANPTVRQAAADAFAVWQNAVAAALRGMYVPQRRAGSLATLMIGALEGAILFARAERDPRALEVTVKELRPLLDAAVRNPPVPGRAAGAAGATGRPRSAPPAARTRSGR